MVLNPIFGGDKLDDFFILWENFKPGISKQYDDSGIKFRWLYTVFSKI
jgi:hypothetical protein